jgi:hypothetical protein
MTLAIHRGPRLESQQQVYRCDLGSNEEDVLWQLTPVTSKDEPPISNSQALMFYHRVPRKHGYVMAPDAVGGRMMVGMMPTRYQPRDDHRQVFCIELRDLSGTTGGVDVHWKSVFHLRLAETIYYFCVHQNRERRLVTALLPLPPATEKDRTLPIYKSYPRFVTAFRVCICVCVCVCVCLLCGGVCYFCMCL